MTRYQKGAKFERELVKKFWGDGWAAMRAAGSGTIKFPVPDVIAVKNARMIAIECKSTKKDRLSLKKAIESLKIFSTISGVETYIAIKFEAKKPRFFDINELSSRGNYTISMHDPYLSFDALIGEQKRL